MRNYKCLHTSVFENDNYKLIPLRHEDKDLIMKWRNEQIDILRQKELLTQHQQDCYFDTVINDLFKTDYPKQLLFSFFENNVFIGYGGLVHIDWESKNGEISFLTETSRIASTEILANDWTNYLNLLKQIAKEIKFEKIYTYAYSSRNNLFPILENNGFVKEATLKNHITINNQKFDVIYHSYFF